MNDYSKITALYSRLSVGDEDRDGGESNSIQNQKKFLESYARQLKLTNIRHYIDDDESGRFFDRSAYSRIVHDDSNGLDYILVGEIYLPLIAVSEEKCDIGFYGSLHRNYLKDYKGGLYSYLTLTGELWTYLADLNEQCVEYRDFLMNQIMEQEGITEELKSRDQMEWVRRANNVRSRVDEIILNELVYV